MPLPLPAPNKLSIKEDMDLKHFQANDIPSLTQVADIHRWYNDLHSKGRVCGVYTPPWEAFNRSYYMGLTWYSVSLSHTVLERQDDMSAAIASILSSPGIFKCECEDFNHLVTNDQGNGYSALFQIVRLVHPVLGQTTAQPAQPMQKKGQPFAAHIANYLDYFQSVLCYGRVYSPNERIILIISRLNDTWRDIMKRKYIFLVPQNGPIPLIPMECQQQMLSVTFTQWCEEERLDAPSAKVSSPSPHVFAIDNLQDLDLYDRPHALAPREISIGNTTIDLETINRALAHVICYVDGGTSKSAYPKCSACGLPGHKIEQCHPLINFCLVQVLAAQHPDIVKRIKAAYTQFPRNTRSRKPRTSSVKELVSMLDLPP
jgi:hypothetical protein